MSEASEELFDSRQRPFISCPKRIDGEPAFGADTAFSSGGNVGSFPGRGEVESAGTEVDLVSKQRMSGAIPPSACLGHSSVESRDMKDVENYRKGACFMNRYCAIYSLYYCGQRVFADLYYFRLHFDEL